MNEGSAAGLAPAEGASSPSAETWAQTQEMVRFREINRYSAVKQSNTLARAGFKIEPGLDGQRVLALAMSKIHVNTDIFGDVRVTRDEVAMFYPDLFRHNGWRDRMRRDLERLLTLQLRIVKPDGGIRLINVVKTAELMPGGDLLFRFHEDVEGHVGLQLQSRFTTYRLAATEGIRNPAHTRLYVQLRSWAYVGKWVTDAEALKDDLAVEGYPEIRLFFHRFVRPAIATINDQTDLNVEATYRGGKGRTPRLEFVIRRKSAMSCLSPLERGIAKLLVRFGMSEAVALELVDDKGVAHCVGWYLWCSVNRSQVKENAGGFLRATIIRNDELPDISKLRGKNNMLVLQSQVLRATFECSDEVEQQRIREGYGRTLAGAQLREWEVMGMDSRDPVLYDGFVSFLKQQMMPVLKTIPFLAGSAALEREIQRSSPARAA